MEDNQEDENFRRGPPSWKLRRVLNVAIWFLYLVFFVTDRILKFCVGRISGWFAKHREKPDAPIVCVNALLCGLSKVGKTSVLYSIKLGEFIPTIPTVETYCEEFDYLFGSGNNQKIRLRIWDVARPTSAAPEGWRRCHWATDCVIFVVDAKDRRRLDEARDELFEIMFEDHYRMVDARFLILANKQDVAKALSRKELESLFALPNDMKDRWRVVGTSAVTGQGLRDGLKWLVKTSTQQSQVRQMNFLGTEDFGDSLETTSIEFTSIDNGPSRSPSSSSSSEKSKPCKPSSGLSPLNLLRPKRTIWGKKTEKDLENDAPTHVSLECGNMRSGMGLMGEHPQHHLIKTRCVAQNSSSSSSDTLILRMKSGDGESEGRMTTGGDLENAKSPLKIECAGSKGKRLYYPSQKL